MSTTRTERAAQPGPIRLYVACPIVDVEVHTSPTATHATITVTTDDDAGPAAEAVRGAHITAEGDRLGATIHTRPGVTAGDGRQNVVIGSMNAGVVNLGGGSVNIAGSAIGYGASITQVAGSHFGTGNVVNIGGAVQGCAVGSPVRVLAVVPEHSTLDTIRVTSGSVASLGQLGDVTVTISEGSVALDRVVSAKVTTNVGGISIAHLTGPSVLKTNVGDIEVYGEEDVVVHATTNVGNITHSRLLDIHARTNIGDVHGVKR